MNYLPTFQIIQAENLILNYNSFRLPKSVQKLSEANVIEYLIFEGVLNELMLSIGQSGFYYHEPLLVTRLECGTFKVIDGNRRLLAVKLLLKPDLVTAKIATMEAIINEVTCKPHEVPCLIFQNESDIKSYLGFNHIKGAQTWRIMEKARFVYGIYKSDFEDYTFKDSCRMIAKSVGTRKEYIIKIIVAFELYSIIENRDFFQINGLNESNFSLYHLTESINQPNIAVFLGVDLNNSDPLKNIQLENLEVLTRWLYEKDYNGLYKISGDEQSLLDLNVVLSNEKAKEAFENGSTLEEAKSIIIDKNFQDLILQSIESLEKAEAISNRIKGRTKTVEEELKNLDLLAKKLLKKLHDAQM